jgi:hypothetical protein
LQFKEPVMRLNRYLLAAHVNAVGACTVALKELDTATVLRKGEKVVIIEEAKKSDINQDA